MFRKMFVVLCTELLQYEILGICVHSDWSVLSGWVCRNNLRTLWFEELTEQTLDLDQLLKEDMNGERGSNGHMKDSLVHMFDVFFWTFIPQTWRIEWVSHPMPVSRFSLAVCMGWLTTIWNDASDLGLSVRYSEIWWDIAIHKTVKGTASDLIGWSDKSRMLRMSWQTCENKLPGVLETLEVVLFKMYSYN